MTKAPRNLLYGLQKLLIFQYVILQDMLWEMIVIKSGKVAGITNHDLGLKNSVNP